MSTKKDKKTSKFQQNNPDLEPVKMAHIRHIKPGFFTHDVVTEMSPLARLAWIGLWTACDKNGRFIWKVKTLKHDILPYDNCDFADILEEIRSHGFVIPYEVNGRTYGYIPNWKKHQAIGTKEARRNDAYPGPDGDIATFALSVPSQPRGLDKHVAGNVPAHDEECAVPEDKDKDKGVAVVEGFDVDFGLSEGNTVEKPSILPADGGTAGSSAPSISKPKTFSPSASTKEKQEMFVESMYMVWEDWREKYMEANGVTSDDEVEDIPPQVIPTNGQGDMFDAFKYSGLDISNPLHVTSLLAAWASWIPDRYERTFQDSLMRIQRPFKFFGEDFEHYLRVAPTENAEGGKGALAPAKGRELSLTEQTQIRMMMADGKDVRTIAARLELPNALVQSFVAARVQ